MDNFQTENQEHPDPSSSEKQFHRNLFYSGNGLAIAIFNYLIGIDESGRNTETECSYPCPFPGGINHSALVTLLEAGCINISLVPHHAPQEDQWPILTLRPDVGAMIKGLRVGIGLSSGEHRSFHHLIGELLFQAFSRPAPECHERTKNFLAFASNLANCPRYQWHKSEHDTLFTLRYILIDVYSTSQIIALNEPDLGEEQKNLFRIPIFTNLQPLFKYLMNSYPATTATVGVVSDRVVSGEYFEALIEINNYLSAENEAGTSQPSGGSSDIPAHHGKDAKFENSNGGNDNYAGPEPSGDSPERQFSPATMITKKEMMDISKRSRKWIDTAIEDAQIAPCFIPKIASTPKGFWRHEVMNAIELKKNKRD